MVNLVVSTWWQGSRQQQARGDAMRRLSTIRSAVGLTDRMIKQSNFEASGLIKGIFVAPEYAFAARLAGFVGPNSGKTRGRSLHAHAHDRLVRELSTLSAMFPRILIIPGTIAWKAPLTEAELERRLGYYFAREKNPPKLQDDVLLRALKVAWKRCTTDDLLYNCFQIDKYKADFGSDMPTRAVTDPELAMYQTDHPEWYKHMVTVAESLVRWEGSAAVLNLAAQQALDRFAVDRLFDDAASNITHMMSNAAYAFLNGKIVFSYNKQSNWQEEIGDPTVVFAPGGRTGVTQIEEMWFGLEVCRDHAFGTLRQQLRSGRELDVQIVLSDYVDVRPENVVVRKKGYFVHASTNASKQGVFKVDGDNVTLAPVLGREAIGNGWLTHWRMDIKVHDPFELADSFMASMFRSR
jgi:hypothetical protein